MSILSADLCNHRTPPSARPTVCILGGAIDNENLGVTALGLGTAAGILRAIPEARIVMATNSMNNVVEFPVDGKMIATDAINLHYSDRLRDRCGTKFLQRAQHCLGFIPSSLRPLVLPICRRLQLLEETDVFMDITGGDSFTDLYGAHVFKQQIAIKEFVLGLQKPLVLLPQTYGPFHDAETRHRAAAVVWRAAIVATREITGVEEIRALVGNEIASRVVMCPDVSFLMEPMRSGTEKEQATRKDVDETLIGLNVSGLLYLSHCEFGIKDSYKKLIDAILAWAMSIPRIRVVLIPHVYSQKKSRRGALDRSDTDACHMVMEQNYQKYGERLTCLSSEYNAAQAKYLIGQCDFMIGARMHSCIAGVSQGVATATLAYSKKATGLMTQLKIAETVVDPRSSTNRDCMDRIIRIFENRDEIASRLQSELPAFRQQVLAFFTDCVAPLIQSSMHAS